MCYGQMWSIDTASQIQPGYYDTLHNDKANEHFVRCPYGAQVAQLSTICVLVMLQEVVALAQVGHSSTLLSAIVVFLPVTLAGYRGPATEMVLL